MSIGQEILRQLGGNRFAMMTGAKNFVASERGLHFSLPGGGGFCKDGINRVIVELQPNDLYHIQFLRVRGIKITPVSEHVDLDVTQLVPVFRLATGLEV